METWFIIVVSLCISVLLKSFFNLIFFFSSNKKLPPGPPTFPVIGNFLWLRKSFSDVEPILKDLQTKYGPVVTLRMGSKPIIFVGSHSIAHLALVQNGAVFSDRPKALPASKILNSNQHNISSAAYGPTWRLLRRNLTSEILHPSRVKSYSRARRWVLEILINRLLIQSGGEAVKVVEHFQYAMFCLLVLMCFGDRLDEKQIKRIETAQRRMLLSVGRFNLLNFWPIIGKILFRNRWKELMLLRQNQLDTLIPLIRDRREVVKRRSQLGQKQKGEEEEEDVVVAYVDTLLDLELPDEKRKINDGEMVSLCGEFLNAGTDTTSTALQWIMASLVKYPSVQAKLYEEIVAVVGSPPVLQPKPKDHDESQSSPSLMKMIKEEDLRGMVYVKAVVLEGLRRHPPGHFVLPHSVTEDVELEGYLVPKNSIINFMVAEMGLDPKVWDQPMEFKPERFLTNSNSGVEAASSLFDITGSKEIKMMPFGAGRRICPGFGLALLHLEFFVANLVWYFEWKVADGEEVDLSEKREFTIVMKNPLRAHISPRANAAPLAAAAAATTSPR